MQDLYISTYIYIKCCNEYYLTIAYNKANSKQF